MSLEGHYQDVAQAAITLANALLDWEDAMNYSSPDREGDIDRVIKHREKLRESVKLYRETLWQVEANRQRLVDKHTG